MGASAVMEVVDALEAGTAKPITQDAAQSSKAPRLKKEQGAIDWSRPAAEIKNQVRALRRWPRAYTFWHPADAAPVRLNIDRVALVDPTVPGDAIGEAAGPGTVVQTSPGLIVATGDGPLEVRELQPAGKRSMPAVDFLRGNRVSAGDRFGFA
jgi:methionyl-tRNA formyltransferase